MIDVSNLMAPTANIYSLVRGSSEGQTPLNAFDNALLNAGVGDTNLMRMSSILPPDAQQHDIADLDLPAGGFLPLAYAAIDSKRPGTVIASAVAVGIPEDDEAPGVIMEFEDEDELLTVEQKARQMVVNAFESRNRELKEIKSIGIDHKVKECASAFAGVVLWYE
ncbi:arginine decarboxylase [Fodinibius salinus]|uniref:Pyruvoyl-dependent arginine decarboxylase AaxB n=1 Tax=Fodinibius salinus TaxID=860790 RepID=A0A5D3YNB7_9BACT|nr:arginine decarboxylase, pyruvoyl-dependent [Fodinibius salinus]TYP95364.1 arginine decarboxylase [Fodinibius salinus]